MKIQKGHYVPKELITSETVHEAVVKCFVAAGFNDERPHFGKFGSICEGDDGLGVYNGDGQPTIMWGIKGYSVDEPLTLQQLFTADNGLQWPSFATEIRTDDNAVWFFGGGQAEHICGSVQPIPHRVLANRQPKEKEVKTIEDAVISLNGKLPAVNGEDTFVDGDEVVLFCLRYHKDDGDCWSAGVYYLGGLEFDRTVFKLICTAAEFESEAKRLGYINGYRWGVEYPTSGKRPDLPDDVEIEWRTLPHPLASSFDRWVSAKAGKLCWSARDAGAVDVAEFRITDQRYKPADTSYLNAVSEISESEPACESVSENLDCKQKEESVSEWWDYENAVAVDLPPVGIKCWAKHPEGHWDHCYIVAVHVLIGCVIYSYSKSSGALKYGLTADQFRPLDHATRKADLERKALIEQAYAIHYKCADYEDFCERLIDAGWRPAK